MHDFDAFDKNEYIFVWTVDFYKSLIRPQYVLIWKEGKNADYGKSINNSFLSSTFTQIKVS